LLCNSQWQPRSERAGPYRPGQGIEKLRWKSATNFNYSMIPEVVLVSSCFFFI
jgi:hypothetical protein